MTDEELIARLRKFGELWPDDAVAADLIEEYGRAYTHLLREFDKRGDRIEQLEAALRRIADTDPDEGTAWFHRMANAALEGAKP